jgi:uncharacterized protein (DUF1800 family)
MSIRLPLAPEPQLAAHALNRIAYGRRPGDLARVVEQGVAPWIEEQLRARPDPAVEARLSKLATLSHTVPEVVTGANSDVRTLALVHEELRSAKLIRAVHSKNQLEEILVDFWFNHFNVCLTDGTLAGMSVSAYEREAIRPHVLGRFRDLLHATANHVAMVFYLDNYLSRSSYSVNGTPMSGLNENYGRELLELHTVGADAGYTQADVIDAARCFTGWGIDNPNNSGTFLYRPAHHDRGAKTVFGLEIAAEGQKDDGDRLLEHLAAHPLTARRICRRLAERFVSDDPPSALIDRCSATFRATDGDLREVLATMFSSPEFWPESDAALKPKTPFEYVVSVLRAADAHVTNACGTEAQLSDMGMPMYRCSPPTGYSNRGSAWLNPSSHLHRMNFALDVADGLVEGARVDTSAMLQSVNASADDAQAVAKAVNVEILGGRLPASALQAVCAAPPGTAGNAASRIIGLCLASEPMQVK